MSEYKSNQNYIDVQKTNDLLKTMPDFCSDFYSKKQLSIAPKTQLNYARRMQMFLRYLVEETDEYAKKELKELTLDDLNNVSVEIAEGFISFIINRNSNGKATNTPRTADIYVETVYTYYAFFIENQYKLSNGDYFVNNPFKKVTRERKTRASKRYLATNDTNALFTALNSGEGLSVRQLALRETTGIRDICICQLLLDTGISVSQLVGIDVDDINLARKYIYIEMKNGLEEKVFFSTETQKLLAEYLDIREELFYPDEAQRALFLSSTRGKNINKRDKDFAITSEYDRLTVRSIQRIVKKYAVASELPNGYKLTPTTLQNTYEMRKIRQELNDSLSNNE